MYEHLHSTEGLVEEMHKVQIKAIKAKMYMHVAESVFFLALAVGILAVAFRWGAQ